MGIKVHPLPHELHTGTEHQHHPKQTTCKYPIRSRKFGKLNLNYGSNSIILAKGWQLCKQGWRTPIPNPTRIWVEASQCLRGTKRKVSRVSAHTTHTSRFFPILPIIDRNEKHFQNGVKVPPNQSGLGGPGYELILIVGGISRTDGIHRKTPGTYRTQGSFGAGYLEAMVCCFPFR